MSGGGTAGGEGAYLGEGGGGHNPQTPIGNCKEGSWKQVPASQQLRYPTVCVPMRTNPSP